MTAEELYAQLDNADSLEGFKDTLSIYLKEQATKGVANPDLQERVAYGLAGLLSAKAVMATSDEDPIKRILLLAGQLELPVEQRSANATWESLVQEAGRL